jgi:hypothetical protein
VLSGEAINTNFIVFGLTRSGLAPMIYHSPEASTLTITPLMQMNKKKEIQFYKSKMRDAQ